MEKDQQGRNIIWYEGKIGNSKGTIANLYDYQIKDLYTLDNIFRYASDEELEAIVHSIYGRICDVNEYANGLTDKELHKLAKGLRKPQ